MRSSPSLLKHHHCCWVSSAVSPSTVVTKRPYSLSVPSISFCSSSAVRRFSASVENEKSLLDSSPCTTVTSSAFPPSCASGRLAFQMRAAPMTSTSNNATAMIMFLVFFDILHSPFGFESKITQGRRVKTGESDHISHSHPGIRGTLCDTAPVGMRYGQVF